MRKTLLSLLGVFLLAGIASAQEQPSTFKVPFHTLNGMILLDTGPVDNFREIFGIERWQLPYPNFWLVRKRNAV